MPAVVQSKSHLELPVSPTHTLSANDEDGDLTKSSSSLLTSGRSHSSTFSTSRYASLTLLSSQVVLGTVFLWFGWLGFNGGSCFAGSIKAALAVFNTNLAGSTGAMTWLLMDFRLERKWSVVGFCTGAIAGLVSHDTTLPKAITFS